jgi:hypothetical protein
MPAALPGLQQLLQGEKCFIVDAREQLAPRYSSRIFRQRSVRSYERWCFFSSVNFASASFQDQGCLPF